VKKGKGMQKIAHSAVTQIAVGNALNVSMSDSPVEQNCKNLLEAYKLCVEEARENTKNRNEANNRFVTILAALVAGMIGASQFFAEYVYILAAAFFVILISLVWMLHIRAYKKINSAKFTYILFGQ
jgi:hypothetical protein